MEDLPEVLQTNCDNSSETILVLYNNSIYIIKDIFCTQKKSLVIWCGDAAQGENAWFLSESQTWGDVKLIQFLAAVKEQLHVF